MDASPSPDYSRSTLTRPSRNAQRVTYDRSAVHAVLDSAFVCHVGFVAEGRPVVLPHVYARRGETLYLHGSTGARALRSADPGGLPVCVTVTCVDGLVLARSAFHHSVNYRSVVVHGVAEPVVGDQAKRVALDAVVNAATPGRSGETRPPSRRELAATALLALRLDEVSLKVRSGSAVDDAEDLELEYWAGVLPLRTVAGEPIPADGVSVPVPGSVLDFGGAGSGPAPAS